MTQRGARPVRADAVRNRAGILGAARQQITEHGPNVAMDQIASAAGVAVGTLYRHFPTKTDLVAAVIGEFVASVADQAEQAASRVRQGTPAFVELAELFSNIVRAAANNSAVKAAARALDANVDDAADAHRAGTAVQSIIEAAQLDRTVRDDLSAADFYLLVSNAPVDQPAAVLDRWVELTIYGIAKPRGESTSLPPGHC